MTTKSADDFGFSGFPLFGHGLTIARSAPKIKNAMDKVLAGFFSVWVVGLTILAGWLVKKYREIVRDFSAEGFKSAADLTRRIVELENSLVFSLRRIGLVRFNPFSGTGGDQSFSLAVMDEKNNGVVITSLHHRESTRLYVKEIVGSKAVGQELADEEKRAINIAKKVKKGRSEK